MTNFLKIKVPGHRKSWFAIELGIDEPNLTRKEKLGFRMDVKIRVFAGEVIGIEMVKRRERPRAESREGERERDEDIQFWLQLQLRDCWRG